MYRSNVFTDINIVNLINNYNQFSINKDKDYWNLKFNSVILEIKYKYQNYAHNFDLYLNWSFIEKILNAASLYYYESHYEIYLCIYDKNSNIIEKYVIEYEDSINYENDGDNSSIYDNVFSFYNNNTKFILELLPYTSLIEIILNSRFKSECEYPSFIGIPKSLKRLALCGFEGVNFNKYKEQLKTILLFDLNNFCGWCGGIYNLQPTDNIFILKKCIGFEINVCDNEECHEYNLDYEPYNYNNFYIKNFKLCENNMN
jgi:hypothetical protein